LALAKGKTGYQLIFNYFTDEKKDTQLSIISNLKGVALTFPEGLGKKTNEKRLLKITFPLNDQRLLPIKASYNKSLKVRLKINKPRKTLHSAHVVWGDQRVHFLTQKGIQIEINRPRFSALKWLGFLKSLKNTPHEKAVKLPIHLTLKTPKLLWGTQNLGELSIQLNRVQHQWEGRLQCAIVAGTFDFNPAEYNFNMDFINVSKLSGLHFPVSTSTSKEIQWTPEKLPLIALYSKKLIWRNVNLGRLNITSQREGTGVFFDSISLTGNNYTLFSIGHWRKMGLTSSTDLQGRFNAKTFGRLLAELGVTHDLKETSARINLSLNWQKPPYDFSFKALNGKVGILLDQGRISSIEPGVGRVLGVLAMEQWVKRLQLNFRDIYEEGLSFNHIRGDYYLHKGLAHTDGLVIDAIPAKITLKGDVDLGKQWLDAEISIIPKSAEALPIAGVIMGTIATTIAQAITGEYEEGFYLRTKYQVRGRWNNLKLISLEHQDGLLPQVWRELTDFSWVTN
jgi:uncharacterized protein YhdP